MGYKYFELDDFTCKCGCGQNHIEPYFVEVLDKYRELVDRPFIISSGYRCPEHDATYGGKGNHPSGLAADIVTPDSSFRYNLLYYARDLDIKRVGIAHNYTHVDIWGSAPQMLVWVY